MAEKSKHELQILGTCEREGSHGFGVLDLNGPAAGPHSQS